MMIPFSPPRMDSVVFAGVIDTLKSGWLTTGVKTKLLEKKIANYCNVENVLAVNSWTSGAELILYWFGVKEGDEVIIPVYTYCATANVIIHRGAKVIMVDVTSDFGIDISKIEEKITSKTKVILPVDVGGFPVDYAGINKLINKKEVVKLFNPRTEVQKKLGRILVLSDAAHSFGANYNNSKIGSQADFTVFSFHSVKNITTAEGGAICINLPATFNNDDIYAHLNRLSLHGQDIDAKQKYETSEWEYDVIDAGFKCNMTDVLASIGLAEFDRYESETMPKKRAIFEFYSDALKKYDWAILPLTKDDIRESSCHLFMLRIKGVSLVQRNLIIKHIFEEEVSVNVHYKPLPLLTFYKLLDYKIADYETSEKIWSEEITLPSFYDITQEQMDRVIEVVVQSVEKVLG